MEQKRRDGRLLSSIAYSSPATNPKYIGGRSVIVQLKTPSGQYIGTLHEIHMPDGSIPHTHPKDYTLRDCDRVRVEREPPPV